MTDPMNIQLSPLFIPIYDNQLSVMGYTALLDHSQLYKYWRNIPSPWDMENKICMVIDDVYKKESLRTYSGPLPLFLSTRTDNIEVLPEGQTVPTDYPLILKIDLRTLWYGEKGFLPAIQELSSSGVQLCLDYWQYFDPEEEPSRHKVQASLLDTVKPNYIKLSPQIVELCQDEDVMTKIMNCLMPLKEAGVCIIGSGIETPEQFERVQNLTDGFEMTWLMWQYLN